MTWRDIFLFQIGNAGAIRRAEASPGLLVMSALLVVTAKKA